jgi:exodeoxyribonuclease VII large subunit
VIIRGGGAVNDLAYLNDYDLAALLQAQSSNMGGYWS